MEERRSPPPAVENPEALARPPYSYVALIAMAIEESPMQRLPLSAIYEAIAQRFPYYGRRRSCKGWQNSIRHNLSLNACFIKETRPLNGPEAKGRGRGHLWAMDPAYRDMFDKGDYRRRCRRPSPQRAHPQSKGPRVIPHQPDCRSQSPLLRKGSYQVQPPPKGAYTVPPMGSYPARPLPMGPYPTLPLKGPFHYHESAYSMHPGLPYHLQHASWGPPSSSHVHPIVTPMFPPSQPYESFPQLHGMGPSQYAEPLGPRATMPYPQEGPPILQYWGPEQQQGPRGTSRWGSEGVGSCGTLPLEEPTTLLRN